MESTADLLLQGLVITIVGMGLVFAALVLLWGLILLLERLFPATDAREAPPVDPSLAEVADGADLTAERARVAAIVAGALMSSAVPLQLQVPVGPTFEHGRTAPSWVTANRSQTLQTWQPPRAQDQ